MDVGGNKVVNQAGNFYGCCTCIGSAGTAVSALYGCMRYEKGYVLNSFEPALLKLQTPTGKDFSVQIQGNIFTGDGNVKMRFRIEKTEKLAFKVRIPIWSKNTSVVYNGRIWKNIKAGCYFEIEEDDDFRKYGKSKEHRPNPLVGMGLFLDGDGIPLTFDTMTGNTNEQITLRPLEQKIIDDFDNSEFVVCTDAGLASTANRKFNDKQNRKFVTTQSLKKLKQFLKDWSLDLEKGWKTNGSDKTFNISKLRSDDDLIKKYYDKYMIGQWLFK